MAALPHIFDPPTPDPTQESTPGPTLADALALFEAGAYQACEPMLLDALARDPACIEALRAVATICRETGRLEAAMTHYRAALQLRPNEPALIGGVATTCFYAGDWARAWAAYEVRFALMDQPPRVTRPGPDGQPVAVPRWDGRQRPDHLMVMGEQGLGDTLQFCRFLPDLIRQGTAVTLVAPQRLHALLRSLSPDLTLAPAETPGKVAQVRQWLPLLSLPLVLGLGERHLNPTGGAYLAPDPARAAMWRDRLGSEGFKVGLVWQGNPDPRIDIGRSAPLAALAPLAQVPGVRLISLQQHDGTAQLLTCGFGARVETLGPEFDAGPDAFADTAAILPQLDLVITVDTAIAHLAGALGRPVWTLLKHVNADWRWLRGRSTTPWYPSMTLWRQPAPGDWNGLAHQVAQALARHSRSHAPRCTGMPVAPVPVGELIDRIGILALKVERITDPARRAHAVRERDALEAVRCRLGIESAALHRLERELASINARLWDIEDGKRACEASGDFGDRFILLARSVYLLNDERARLKRDINALTGSPLVETKSHAEVPLA